MSNPKSHELPFLFSVIQHFNLWHMYRISVSYSHMPQFMSNGEGCTQSVVLNYGAARVTVTHFAQFCQSKSITFPFFWSPADVLSVNSILCKSHFIITDAKNHNSACSFIKVCDLGSSSKQKNLG